MDHNDGDMGEGIAAAERRLEECKIETSMREYLRYLDITGRITFKERRVINAGGYGDISVGDYDMRGQCMCRVAVKRFRFHLKDDVKLLLEKEVYVWSKLHHANVLPLLGYAFDEETGYPMLVSLWMENGTAWKYVTSYPKCDLLRLITGIARGLAYLHEKDIIHSDIKSDNVLVSTSGDALICDFGFSRMLNASRSLGLMSISGGGTPLYLAHELLADPENYPTHSKESDVWAFGLTVYELYTRNRPYESLPQHQILLQIVQGKLLHFPKAPVDPHSASLTELLRTVCENCWILDPGKRVNMSVILDMLQKQMLPRLPPSSSEVEELRPTQAPPDTYISGTSLGSSGASTLLQDSQPHPTSAAVPSVRLSPPPGLFSLSTTNSHDVHPITVYPGSGYDEQPYGYRTGNERHFHDAVEARLLDLEPLDLESRKRERETCDRDEQEVKRIRAERLTEHSPSSALTPYPDYDPSTPVASLSSHHPPSPSTSSTPYLSPTSLPSADIFLAHLDLDVLPSDYKKEGTDWYAVFNPRLNRVLDINLTHTLVHEYPVYCVRFSADGRYIATGCEGTVHIYDTNTGQEICALNLNEESAGPDKHMSIYSVCFSPDGGLLAMAGEATKIRIWDIAKKRVDFVFEGHKGWIYSLAFSKTGRLLVSGSDDATVRVWDMETGMHKVFEADDAVDDVYSVAISPDDQLVAASSSDDAVRIWGLQSGKLIGKLLGHRDSVSSVAFTPDGKGVVIGSHDSTLKYLDISAIVNDPRRDPISMHSMSSSSGTSNSSSGVVIHANGGSERGSTFTLNFAVHKKCVRSVAVSHNGQWFASGSDDESVVFCDARTAEMQFTLWGHTEEVSSVNFSPIGGMFATGSGTGRQEYGLTQRYDCLVHPIFNLNVLARAVKLAPVYSCHSHVYRVYHYRGKTCLPATISSPCL